MAYMDEIARIAAGSVAPRKPGQPMQAQIQPNQIPMFSGTGRADQMFSKAGSAQRPPAQSQPIDRTQPTAVGGSAQPTSVGGGSAQPAPQTSPAANKDGLRHYRDANGQIVSTSADTLPQGARWVKWNEGSNDPKFNDPNMRQARYGYVPTGWVDIKEGDQGYIKPETADEKKVRLAKEAQENYAKQFRADLPQNEQRLLGQLGQDTSEMIKEGTRGIREGAASRGLLYSGMRKGAEGGLRQKASMAMATGAQGIRRGLLSQADKLDSQAIQSGIDIQQNQQAMNDAIYRQALGEYQGEMGMWGSLMQAGGTAAAMMMMSDINAKKDIKDAVDDLKDFLQSIQPYSYLYTKEKHGVGRHYSVMAQDLEKTDIGKSFVIDTPDGKMVDYGKAFGVLLAAISSIDKRLERLGV